MTLTPAEHEERMRLESCQARIQDTLRDIDTRLDESASEIQTRKSCMWDARRDMDHIEKIVVRQTIEQTERSAECLQAQGTRLRKLLRSPHFGRFDFGREGGTAARADPVYVGVHHFRDESAGQTLVYDWRAPISSIFHDHELGPARYVAPSGEVAGRVSLKRQFRIRDGQMEFMLESGLNVVDDVLQQELSRTSDEGRRYPRGE